MMSSPLALVALVATLPLATSDCRRTSPVPRVDAATLSGTRLLEEFVLRDVPVVLSSAVDVARLAGLEGWDAPPAWVDALLGELAVAADGAASLRNESAGCEGGCRVAAARSTPRRRPRTDAACVPSWSLQVTGLTRWTFERRSPAEVSGVFRVVRPRRASLGRRDRRRRVRERRRVRGGDGARRPHRLLRRLGAPRRDGRRPDAPGRGGRGAPRGPALGPGRRPRQGRRRGGAGAEPPGGLPGHPRPRGLRRLPRARGRRRGPGLRRRGLRGRPASRRRRGADLRD